MLKYLLAQDMFWFKFKNIFSRSDSIAEAEEAENFFDVAAKSMDEMREMLRSTDETEILHESTGLFSFTVLRSRRNFERNVSWQLYLFLDSNLPSRSSHDDRSSLHSLHQRLFLQPPVSSIFGHSTEARQTKLKLPPLPQKYFVHLWRSLHDLVNIYSPRCLCPIFH